MIYAAVISVLLIVILGGLYWFAESHLKGMAAAIVQFLTAVMIIGIVLLLLLELFGANPFPFPPSR